MIEETNRIGVQFLFTDLTTALTLLNLADGTPSGEAQQRNRNLARSIYETVLRLLARVSPSDGELQALEAKLYELKTRLAAFGYVFGNT